MTAKRKYSRRTNQTSLRKKGNFVAGYWIFGLILISGLLAWREKQPLNPVIEYQKNLSPVQINNKEIKTDKPTINPSQFQNAGFLDQSHYNQLDAQAAAIDYQGTSVAELASLLSPYVKTENEKARIIYAWLAHHIDYDVAAFLSGNYGDVTPETVLQNHRTVCSGYANLYQALAKEMGLEAVIIEGYAKGANSPVSSRKDINHAWNGVKINGQWYLIDPTWGAGTVEGNQFNREYNSYYFATAPEQLIYNHFPSVPDWQLLLTPYSREEFDNLPEVSPQFFQMGLKLVNKTHTLKANNSMEIELEAPENIIATAKLSQGGVTLPDTYQFVQKKGGVIAIDVSFPGTGTYELKIFAKPRQTGEIYPHVVTYRIMAEGVGQEFAKTYKSFTEQSVTLYTPLLKNLPAGNEVYFKLEVPQAISVQVINTESQKWTPLQSLDGVFSGSVPVGTGKVSIVAQFPGDSRYWTLIEYN